MRSQNASSEAWRETLCEHPDGPKMLNDTLSHPSDWCEAGEVHTQRRGFPSVRPLTISAASVSASRRSEDRYIDPSHGKRFLASGVSPLRRNAASVASSCRSAGSLVPSSLRYIGFTPSRSYPPIECESSTSVATQQQFLSPQPVQPSTRFRVRSPRPQEVSNQTRFTPLHPLLKQALLLTATAEVEERLIVYQEESDGFDDIVALFSVAKEVEAVRVAAFDMFEFEVNARRALYTQQRRERRILWYWYLESYRNAVLSQEVRALQLGDGQMAIKQAESLLRSRSTSLQQRSHDLFDPKLEQNSSSPPQRSVHSVNVEGVARAKPSSPKRQLSYPANSSLNNRSTRTSPEEDLRSSQTSTSSSPSASSTSSPAQSERSLSRTTESLVAAGEPMASSARDSDVALESKLDNRIARQQLLLASGGTTHNNLSTPLFPSRLPPKTPHNTTRYANSAFKV
ncbi:hypothetical protein ABB37_04350 [Leptomonas pyrrhocoris]|uniref:Uncharacterized protein n=1 Tax=Leptomonas pyrrhocoris TaxID=157538 RepID=A0A0M9G2A1_LEPPY|nr:hypothetical protein ABB37_04350 [Leptomonas pyrrhocoris]KPA80960.1 hypothetical protein ABB37_04350 [Leptomonas pyrrhocoris]|eukprot:XP_015659399.1 hypothetical protein ABB37_04350 [Leptomonas pyrrhocoris]